MKPEGLRDNFARARSIPSRKPRVLTPLRSLRIRNEVELVPLACEDGSIHDSMNIPKIEFIAYIYILL